MKGCEGSNLEYTPALGAERGLTSDVLACYSHMLRAQ